ncbi:HET-domain-containing protein [Xylaria curta]|nr:HET-domain-containing protein [Xylaria curta]
MPTRRCSSSLEGNNTLVRLYQSQLKDRDYEVRLLKLFECASSTSGYGFECRLQCFSLKDNLNYVALSYCWGDLPNTKNLVVENTGVPVSETLLLALKQLWHMGNTLLWVDYLCINQDDSDEKSGQVRMMDIIFSKATIVFAWLGTGDHDSDMAMAVLGGPRLSEQVELPEEAEIACEAVIRLLSRPYWTRCWVIQEICRARFPVILCGSRSVTWSTMLRRLDGLGTSVPAQYAQHLISPLRYMRDREQNKLRAGTEISLIPLLVLSRRSLASDPRDKLYALLSLANDGRTLIPTPNYSQTAEQVFFDTARCMIEDHDRTDIILLAHRTRGQRNLPSWAPDWANIHSQLPPWVMECLDRRHPWHKIYNKIHKNIFEVRGRRYDTIIGFLDSAAHDNKHEDVTNPHYYMAETVTLNLIMGLAIRAPAELDRIVMIQALLEMCDSSDGRMMRRPSRLRDWIVNNANRMIGGATLARCLEVYLKFHVGVDNNNGNLTDTNFERTQFAIEEGFEYLETLRMVFAITRGNQLRIVHKDAKPDDGIYILQNCPLPVILRQNTIGTFRYIGEVFVSPRFKAAVMNNPSAPTVIVHLE